MFNNKTTTDIYHRYAEMIEACEGETIKKFEARNVLHKALKNMESSCTVSESDFTGEYLGVRRFNHETGKIERIPKEASGGCEACYRGSLGTGWVSVEEDQPKPQQRVYVVCENPKYGGGVVRFQTMAEYIPYMTVKEEDYMADEYQGEGDYNEEEDEYYTPKGFYEWQSEPEMHWKISAKVTHWMPLIELP